MKWSVLTLVGGDKPGIVAAVTQALFDQGCALAQASMMRLGSNFAIMLRVSITRKRIYARRCPLFVKI